MPDRFRILFVDDEPRILEGIGRMLRPQRATIEVLTAPGGNEALQFLAREPVQVLISDMRMPLMDGVQLLAEVRNRHPSVVRIILSGQSDRETIVRATGVAHQFLSKPCSVDELHATIARCRGLEALLPEPALRARLTALDGWPTVPGTLERLARVLQTSKETEWTGEQIAADPGLAGKVAQVSATSFFGTSKGPLAPADAGRRLGADVIRTMLAAGCLPEPGPAGYDWAGRARHATRTAALARAFAAEAAPALVAQAELLGMLHDCGIAALSCVAGDRYANLPEHDEEALCATERATFGTTHAEVGAFVLALWGINEQMVAAVARHHRPEACRGPEDVLLSILIAAEALALSPDAALNGSAMAACGVAGRVDGWRALARRSPA